MGVSVAEMRQKQPACSPKWGLGSGICCGGETDYCMAARPSSVAAVMISTASALLM